MLSQPQLPRGQIHLWEGPAGYLSHPKVRVVLYFTSLFELFYKFNVILFFI